MQLSAPLGALPPTADVPTALRVAATRLGHRPAITVLRPDRRDEQGYASLAQWAAKGAHLLMLEAQLQPGDRVGFAMPAGWTAAAVCLAAWWAGLVVAVGRDVDVAVVHESLPPPADVSEVYVVGDAVDGSPLAPGEAEAWALAVQAFPDQPPPPGADPDSLAIEFDGETWTQAELLEEAGRWGFEGALGIAADTPPEVWLPALARPLLVGRPTVVLAGVSRQMAEAESVGVWA